MTREAEASEAVSSDEPAGMAAAAILVNEIEDVLEARMAVGEQCVARAAKIFCLSGRDSETACRRVTVRR